MKPQKNQDSQNNPEQKNNAGGFAIPDLQTYYRAKVNQMALAQEKGVNQWKNNQ